MLSNDAKGCGPHAQLYELETAYLSAEHSQCGTVLKVILQSVNLMHSNVLMAT